MSKKPGLPEKTAPIMIPTKLREDPTRAFSKSAPNKHFSEEDFFVGSPKSGASLKQSKICSDFLTKLFSKSEQKDPADEDKDRSLLTGESDDE